MQTFFEWLQAQPTTDAKPWLVLGKGPGFASRHDHDLAGFHLLALNHVVRELPVAVAHAIDLDVITACAESIEANARVLVMPWVPHVDNRPGHKTLSELAASHPVLARLEAQGRLACYNLSTVREARPGSPVVQAKFFSAEAAVDLLARAGVSVVRSLGVDGGAAYSADFDDLKDQTLLSNGRSSFNRQFEGIARTMLETGLDFAPLDLQAPVRVFVAATESELVPTQVLAYSIRKHASLNVEVVPLGQAPIQPPLPRDVRNHPRTPFSFQRFLIPALAGYRGRAIYLDSDMQVFQDIRSLWTLPMDDFDLLAVGEPTATGRKPQFSVMLLDCERLRWEIQAIVDRLDTGELTYERLMHDMAVAERIGATIDPSWNSLERYHEGTTALLHYTDMNTQPWVSTANPLGYLWVRDLLEAIDRGHIERTFVDSHIDQGYLRPSLRHQLDHRIPDPLLLPRSVKALDRTFAAPFTRLPRHGARPWTGTAQWMNAVIRQTYQKSPLYQLKRRLHNRLFR